MNLSLDDQARTSVQKTAQNRGITGLHDNEMWAARNSLFGVTCNCAAGALSMRLRSTTSGTSATAGPATIRAAASRTAASGAANPGTGSSTCNAERHSVIRSSHQRRETRRSQRSAEPDSVRRWIEGPAILRIAEFLTLENAAHVPPMTAGQKFKVAARSSFDYVQYPWYAVLAGISQAQNSEPGYGQGAEGYAKRYASEFADGTIENFMVNAVVPSLLHTDPRYYQLGKGGFLHRTGYALSRLVITRTDSGHNTFNFGEIGGSFAAAAISTYSYQPEADKTLSNTASVWGTQVGYDAIRIVLNEFWPDIRRKFYKTKSEPQP